MAIHLRGATLPASKNKQGGHRPIAVGEVLRQFHFQVPLTLCTGGGFQYSHPLQLEVGVRVGREAIVHSVASTLEDPSIPSNECWMLLLDFKNAFN